jgi:hypothetical protein
VASLAVRPHRKTEFPPCSDWKRKTLAAPTIHRDSSEALFRSQILPLNSTMQKEDFLSHQNAGKCMEY